MSERVAGVDEAGCGPLAGPVVVAAVILDPARPIEGLDDSKKLTQKRREAAYPLIIERALAWRIEFVQAGEIDALNILQARLLGMHRALCALTPAATRARIDGNRLPKDLPCPAEAVVGGDALEPAIMAASILAKVARDQAMLELHAQFPQYGFDRHKGYPSPLHLAALREHGPCPQHRRSFAPVQQSLLLL
ncbi:MAG TPA: ribonuclease HII [Luteimonas sp.]|nr:ribonuclease HII [Luteimonas sp.]HRP72255.1 ribonuclease HII [Luteimonas sp.]